MSMIIEHRGVYQDRFDAPYGIGTMIWAKDCHHNCPGCIHSDRHDEKLYEEDLYSVFIKIRSNPFTQGIVLGGFEWTEQYDQMIAMIEEARSIDMEVILYTHYTAEEISTKYPQLLKYKSMYIKCGEYREDMLDPTYVSYGVPLASTNQRIYKVGVDI